MLPSGRLAMTRAKVFAVVTAVAGTALVGASCPITATVMAVATIAINGNTKKGCTTHIICLPHHRAGFAHTLLKPVTPFSTYVGAIGGALPAMVGWAARAGSLDFGALALTASLYFWQMPHFHSVTYMVRSTFEEAGYKLLAVVRPDRVGLDALWHTAAMIPLGVIFAHTGVTGSSFALTSLLPTGYLTWRAFQFYQYQDTRSVLALRWSTYSVFVFYMTLLGLHHFLPLDHVWPPDEFIPELKTILFGDKPDFKFKNQ